MKPAKLLYSILSIILLPALISCSSDNDDPYGKKGVAVEKIEATAPLDLSARSDWMMTVGGIEYSTEIEENRITGISSSEKNIFHFEYGDKRGTAQIIFRHPNYRKNARSEAAIPPNFEDQSTLENFTKFDLLIYNYQGEQQPELTQVKLKHYNALLDFSVSNIPEEAKVLITQKITEIGAYTQTITPLQDSEDPTRYKAIVSSHNLLESLYVSIEINGEKVHNYRLSESKAQNRMPAPIPSIGESTILTFDAFIDINGRFIIENLKKKAYTNNWPISQ